MSDLISRQDAIEILSERAKSLRGMQGDLGGACRGAMRIIESLPSAEPERIEKIHDDKIHPTIHHCGHDTLTLVKPAWNYCPNCGMKLEWI